MKNLLFTSVGRRGRFIKDVVATLPDGMHVVATDCSSLAPALYFADKYYIVPKIDDDLYIPAILDICRKEHIGAIASLIDPEISLLASQKEIFAVYGVQVLSPDYLECQKCFDKFLTFQWLNQYAIPTIATYETYDDFLKPYNSGKIDFPVFVKPRTGSGSVGARKVTALKELEMLCSYEQDLIIQEYISGIDISVDAYTDLISGKMVAMFSNRKLNMVIGGASKTVSFKSTELYDFIKNIAERLKLFGPVNFDIFYKDKKYLITEINPRFSGCYIHAHSLGVNFISLAINNMSNIINQPRDYDYKDNMAMLMYDEIKIISYNN